jgi:addiction module RelE/StbE family toxin
VARSRRRALVWTGPALDDLREIKAYVAADNPAAARKLAGRIREGVEVLRENPEAGRVVPELAKLGYREVIVPPYRVVYEVQERRVVVLRVWHGRRDMTGIDL